MDKGINYVCKEGTQEWLDSRKSFITASSAYTILEDGNLPKWWSNTKQDIIDGKFNGIEATFDRDSKRKMWWGSYDEATNMVAASEVLGIPMARHQWLVNNPRWEHLAGTPDGLAYGDVLLPPNYEPAVSEKQVDFCRERVAALGGVGVVEMKNTREPFRPRGGGPASWFDYPPEYYKPQVQFQMALLDLDWALLIGKTGGNGLCPHFIQRDRAFDDSMDKLNDMYGEWIVKYGD